MDHAAISTFKAYYLQAMFKGTANDIQVSDNAIHVTCHWKSDNMLKGIYNNSIAWSEVSKYIWMASDISFGPTAFGFARAQQYPCVNNTDSKGNWTRWCTSWWHKWTPRVMVKSLQQKIKHYSIFSMYIPQNKILFKCLVLIKTSEWNLMYCCDDSNPILYP
jgi:uncharacterized membrane protein YecN with MAPEG domain